MMFFLQHQFKLPRHRSAQAPAQAPDYAGRAVALFFSTPPLISPFFFSHFC
jgi:hypothetical protein